MARCDVTGSTHSEQSEARPASVSLTYAQMDFLNCVGDVGEVVATALDRIVPVFPRQLFELVQHLIHFCAVDVIQAVRICRGRGEPDALEPEFLCEVIVDSADFTDAV